MTFEALDNGTLMLLHTILHQEYSVKGMELGKLYGFHKSVVMEMNQRGMVHSYVDKMDDE